MSLISDHELDQVRSRTDIVEVIGERVPLKRSGRNLKGCCPFHAEKTPSFMVHPDKQIYHCFGCGVGGDVFSFLMKYDGLEFVEVVEKLADRYGITLSREAGNEQSRQTRSEKDLCLRINQLAARYFQEVLLKSDAGSRGRDYLSRREIGENWWSEASLGVAPAGGKALSQFFQKKGVPVETALKLGLLRQGAGGDVYDFFRDRLVFAIVSGDGRILGFSARALEDAAQPKYINSPESPVYHKGESFLGLNLARAAIRDEDQVLLVEGNFDMLRLHQSGIRNVVAPLGTALTDLQVRALSRTTKNFVLIFDGDTAGKRAAFRALEVFLPFGISPRVVLLPDGEDPDTFVRQKGADALRQLVVQAPTLMDVRMEAIFEANGNDPQGQSRSIQEVAALVSLLPSKLEKNLYFQRVGQRFGISESAIADQLGRLKRRDASFSRKTSNFPEKSGDDKGRLEKIPPLERTVLEVLVSGHKIPDVLFQEIGENDFMDPTAQELWMLLREDHARNGHVDVSRVLSAIPEGPRRSLLTGLVVRGSQWHEEGDQAVTDCLRQLRARGIRDRLKVLTTEIRRAEMEHNGSRLQDLMTQKNELIRLMTSLH